MYSKIACGLALAVGMTNGAAHNLVRRDGAHGHEASSSYSEPAASSYGAPASAPASGYGAPADDLGSYEPSYGATGYGEPETPFDISTLIIPLLIIFGLSLLFPTSTTVDVNAAERRRRSLGKKNTHCTNSFQFQWIIDKSLSILLNSSNSLILKASSQQFLLPWWHYRLAKY